MYESAPSPSAAADRGAKTGFEHVYEEDCVEGAADGDEIGERTQFGEEWGAEVGEGWEREVCEGI